MSDLDTHALDRIIVARMVGIALVCATFFLSTLYVQTSILDFRASNSNNEEISRELDAWTESLHLSEREFLNAQDLLSSEVAQQGRDRNTYDKGIDWFAILDQDGRTIFQHNVPLTLNASNYFGGPTFVSHFSEANRPDDNGEIASAGAFAHSESLFLLAVRNLNSAEKAATGNFASSVLVTGKNIDERALENLREAIDATNLIYSSSSDHPGNGLISLEGPLGFAGNLIWQAELQGTVIQRVVMPWLLLICATFVLLTAWLARNFRMMSESMTRIHAVATTDQLTGVANRTALNEILKGHAVQNALEEGAVAVISLDLNDFKNLNDKLGHDAGDMALKITAERISSSLRRDDSVIRMGGDEFLCLVFDPEPAEVAYKIVDRLLSAFSMPMLLGQNREIVTPSIGVAVSDPGEKWDVIRERSDAAMYRAKRGKLGNNFCFS